MVDGMILWRTADGAASGGWLRVVDGRIVQRGEGSDWRTATGLVALPAGERALVVVPGADVGLHWIACPGMTVRQGAAAAPLMAMAESIGPVEALHGATKPAFEPEQPHLVAVAAREAMERWIEACTTMGVSDAVLTPAPLLLPAPGEGFAEGVIGGEAVLRGTDCALVSDPALRALIVGDAPIRTLDAGAVDEALLAAFAQPPMDLRQGGYAVRRAGALDPAWLRRMAGLTAAIAMASLLIALVTILRLNLAASALDVRTLALAQEAVPHAADVGDAQAKLSALVAARGADGFTRTAAGIMAAMQSAPGVTMTGLSQLTDGTVRVQLAGSSTADVNIAILALQNAGWTIVMNGVQQQGARSVVDISVVPS